MKKCLLTILFLVFQINVNAQNKVLDSLKAKLETHPKADTLKANLLKDIATQLIYINPKRGLVYAGRLLDLSREIKQPKFTSNAYRIIAASNNTLGDYKKMVSYAEKALVIDRQLKDNFNQGIDYNIMGVSYQAQGNFVAALPFFQKAITLWEKDKKIAYINMAKTNVAMIYFELKEFDKALAGLKEPLEFYRSKGILYGEGALLTVRRQTKVYFFT
jgi:tetratricopeptide (TPR) repeat protein